MYCRWHSGIFCFNYYLNLSLKEREFSLFKQILEKLLLPLGDRQEEDFIANFIKIRDDLIKMNN